MHRLENEFRDNINQALRAIGLISDSPPGSPYHITENNMVETDNAAANKDNVIGCIDNVLDLDCHLVFFLLQAPDGYIRILGRDIGLQKPGKKSEDQ